MKIGIISDTHDQVEHAKKAVKLFQEKNVDRIIHCGDFCSPFMIELFKSIPTDAIFGNNDGDLFMIQQKALQNGLTLHGGFWETEIEGVSVAVYHGTYSGITNSLIESKRYNVVITGHTHQVVSSMIGSTLHLNPGTCNGFGGKASVLILDLPTKMYEEFVIG